MKRVTIKKSIDQSRKTKSFFIREKSEDKESVTHIDKGFIYKISRSNKVYHGKRRIPEIFIRKEFDSVKGIEKVRIDVIGHIHTRHNRFVFRVDYHHTLVVHILWKENAAAPM